MKSLAEHVEVCVWSPVYAAYCCFFVFCSAHDEWLNMKLCKYVGYHDANNVSNVGGDPVTQSSFKTCYNIIYAVLRTWRSIAAAISFPYVRFFVNFFS